MQIIQQMLYIIIFYIVCNINYFNNLYNIVVLPHQNFHTSNASVCLP